MPKPIEEQCKICQLSAEDRLNIEAKLKQGLSLNQTLSYIKKELYYHDISRLSLYRHKKHMSKVFPPHIPKSEIYIATAKPKKNLTWYSIES